VLTRQKVILALLHKAGGTLTHTLLVKYAFLLRHETGFGTDHDFYDFVPYKYGPFSFGLYRELGTLARDGLVMSADDRVTLESGTAQFSATDAEELDSDGRRAVTAVVTRYGRMSHHSLLREVYGRYPWYATKSERQDLAPKQMPRVPRAALAVYSVGYEGKSVDRFFDSLLRAGIQAILDVRANPISRKYGFARRSLSEIAGKLGLDYHHLPELGIPTAERAHSDDFASLRRLLDRYEQEMLPQQRAAVAQAARMIQEKPSALLCMEKDAARCHRSRLASALSRATGLPIVHL